MKAQVYWTIEKYPGRLAIVARPRGGDWLEDEAVAWSQSGLDVIVSLLEADEAADLDLLLEAEACQEQGLSFFSFPIVDRSVPAQSQSLAMLLTTLQHLLMKGKNIGIHCRQSIGRSSLVAASLMTLFGLSPDEAFQRLSSVRGLPVPETPEQREWVENFAKKLSLLPV